MREMWLIERPDKEIQSHVLPPLLSRGCARSGVQEIRVNGMSVYDQTVRAIVYRFADSNGWKITSVWSGSDNGFGGSGSLTVPTDRIKISDDELQFLDEFSRQFLSEWHAYQGVKR